MDFPAPSSLGYARGSSPSKAETHPPFSRPRPVHTIALLGRHAIHNLRNSKTVVDARRTRCPPLIQERDCLVSGVEARR
jgi:hypothetical protein